MAVSDSGEPSSGTSILLICLPPVRTSSSGTSDRVASPSARRHDGGPAGLQRLLQRWQRAGSPATPPPDQHRIRHDSRSVQRQQRQRPPEVPLPHPTVNHIGRGHVLLEEEPLLLRDAKEEVEQRLLI